MLLAGCGSSHLAAGGSTTTAPTTATTTAPVTTSPPTTTASSTSTATASDPTTTSIAEPSIAGPSTPAECTSTQLAGSVGSGQGTAGTSYFQLELRNNGSAACFVQGYPGVQFLAAGDGRPDGAPARRVSGPAPAVVLGPGDIAYATVGVADAANFGSSCLMTAEEGFRIYPPDQTSALYVGHPEEGCGNPADQTLSVRPLRASPRP